MPRKERASWWFVDATLAEASVLLLIAVSSPDPIDGHTLASTQNHAGHYKPMGHATSEEISDSRCPGAFIGACMAVVVIAESGLHRCPADPTRPVNIGRQLQRSRLRLRRLRM